MNWRELSIRGVDLHVLLRFSVRIAGTFGPGAALALSLTVAGCASPPTATTTRTVTTSPIRNTPTPRADNEPLNKPAGISKTMYARAGVLPLGAVPFDNMTLPLVSPDGRYVATQIGVAPPWSTILAEPDAPQDRKSVV